MIQIRELGSLSTHWCSTTVATNRARFASRPPRFTLPSSVSYAKSTLSFIDMCHSRCHTSTIEPICADDLFLEMIPSQMPVCLVYP